MTPAIETSGLRVSFGEHTVLDGIDLQVQRGTVYALLAPDAGTARVAIGLTGLKEQPAGHSWGGCPP